MTVVVTEDRAKLPRGTSMDTYAADVAELTQALNLQYALHFAYAVVAVELIVIAIIRYKFMKSPLWSTVFQVIVGGGIVFLLGVWLGTLGISD